MVGYYDLSIVALSIAVAIIASYTALDLASRVSARDSSARKSSIWLVAGAVSMGTGIWSMHFIGMLSFHLPIKFAFDLPITLLSLSREKIPRAMIAAATQQDQENAAMVRAINGLARELSIEVMAQGVENEARRDLLSGVPSTTKVQGFYYSALLPASGATDLLRQGLIEPRLSEVSGEAAAH